MDDRNLGHGRESQLGGAQLRSRFRSHQQIVEFGQIVQGEWEGLVEKRHRKGSPAILTVIGMKQPKTSQGKRLARIRKKVRVKHDHVFIISEF